MREHEKEVYDALYKYWNKVLEESGHLNTTLEMGEQANRWSFDVEEVGVFVFTYKNIEVYATPYWENAEGIAYAIYQEGDIQVEGTFPLVVTGDSMTDTEGYIGIVDDLITLHNL